VAVIELSKLFMTKHWYGSVKATYGDRARLIYMDTDSLVTEIQTDDVYEDRGRGTSDAVWDTSGYPEDSSYYCKQNQKVIGQFKDECGGPQAAISKFVALRPKVYAYEQAEGSSDRKSKGTKKSVTKDLNLDHYKDTLFNHTIIHREQCSIQSKAHSVYTQRQNKIALSPFDSKRWIAPDGLTSLPFGHYRIPK
jgi:hypothetical protein